MTELLPIWNAWNSRTIQDEPLLNSTYIRQARNAVGIAYTCRRTRLKGNVTEKSRLLSLAKAARMLGVHPTTLRRWADHGDILVMLTPGGHRRFPLSEIARLKATSSKRQGAAAEIVDRALMEARERLASHSREGWLHKFDDTQKVKLRSMGQEVLNLLQDYLSRADPQISDDSVLDRIRHIGTQYGELAAGVELSLSELLEATSFFRDSTLESAVVGSDTTNESFRNRFRSINTFFNTLLVSASLAYQTDSH